MNKNEKKIKKLKDAIKLDFLECLAWAGIAFCSFIILLWCLGDV